MCWLISCYQAWFSKREYSADFPNFSFQGSTRRRAPKTMKRIENLCFSSMMKVIILLSDMMSLSFFFLVKEEGSWLDVGLSISNFSIVLLMNISITLIMALANYLTTKSFTANQKLQ